VAAVRARMQLEESVQMLQCIHFLWPPWLAALLFKQSRTAVRNALDVLIANLPYL